MDWIGKLEEEKRAEEQRQAQTQATKLKRESEESDRFQIVKDKLCPVIEATISELKKRTGFELQLNIGDTGLVVRAPQSKLERFKMDGAWYERFGRITDHRFEISSVSEDGQTVRIQAIRAGKTNRNPDGWEESGMSHADYFGSDETVIDTQNEIGKLVSEDIHLLLDWVVRQELEGKGIPPPELSGVRQQKEDEKQRRRKGNVAILKAYGSLAISIVALLLMFGRITWGFFGPISIYLGLCSRRELSSLRTYKGQGIVNWTIGLGIFELIMLLLAVLWLGPRARL